jgi:HEAT repeat protein
MIAYLETERAEAVALACRVLREIVNPDMIVPGMRRLKSGTGRGASISDLGNLAEALSKQSAALVVDALLPIPQGNEDQTLLMIPLAGRLNDPRACDALRAIIWEPEDPMRNSMKESFGRSAIAVTALVDSPVPDARSIVMRALESPDAYIRLRAVSGLTAPLGRKPLSTDLLLLLAKRLQDDDATVRDAAVVAAVYNPIPGAETELITWLTAPDPMKRSSGLLGLGSKYATPAAIDAMATCLHDPDTKVQAAAIRALGRTANRLVVPHLLDAFSSLSIKAKKEVLNSLNLERKALIDHPQVFPFLLSVMGDPDLDTANAAEQLVWRIRLTDEQRALAESAREELQRRRDQPAVKPPSP